MPSADPGSQGALETPLVEWSRMDGCGRSHLGERDQDRPRDGWPAAGVDRTQGGHVAERLTSNAGDGPPRPARPGDMLTVGDSVRPSSDTGPGTWPTSHPRRPRSRQRPASSTARCQIPQTIQESGRPGLQGCLALTLSVGFRGAISIRAILSSWNVKVMAASGWPPGAMTAAAEPLTSIGMLA